MAEKIRFRVHWDGDEWVVRRDDALWNAWLDDPGKYGAIRKAYRLAEGFRPSVVTVHHEGAPATKREFPARAGGEDCADAGRDPAGDRT